MMRTRHCVLKQVRPDAIGEAMARAGLTSAGSYGGNE